MHYEPLFSVFGNGITLYGIFNAVGVLTCFGFLYLTMKFKKFNEASSDTILLIGIIATGFGFLAASLFQGFYNFIADPKGGFNLDGRTFIGGLIGGIVLFLGIWNLYIYVIYPRTKIKWPKTEMNATLNDAVPFIPIGICIAHAFGRLGCFFGGCCYGTEAEWGLTCAHGYSELLGMYMDDVSVVPLQLFEMAFLFILAGVMAALYFKTRFRNNLSVYLIGYGIWRFVIEFFRGDDRGEIFPGAGLAPSQIWSLVMIVIGIGYIFAHIYYFRKLMKHPELTAQAVAPEGGEAVETVTEVGTTAQASSGTEVGEEAQELKDKKTDKGDKPKDGKNK